MIDINKYMCTKKLINQFGDLYQQRIMIFL